MSLAERWKTIKAHPYAAPLALPLKKIVAAAEYPVQSLRRAIQDAKVKTECYSSLFGHTFRDHPLPFRIAERWVEESPLAFLCGLAGGIGGGVYGGLAAAHFGAGLALSIA